MMTVELAAARYLQIKALEDATRETEKAIADTQKEIDDATERLHELQKTKRSLLKDMREAAADESQLPIPFDPVDVRMRLSVVRAAGQAAM